MALDLENIPAAAQPRGTPQETEKLDLIDGFILGLVRQARDAAETASKELGEPALLAAFELTVLYPAPKKKKDSEGADSPPGAKPAGSPGSPEAKPAAESGGAPTGEGTG